MIRSLRKRHFAMISGLCLGIPSVFVLALALRTAIPVSESFPERLDPVPPSLAFHWESRATAKGVAMSIRTGFMGSRLILEVAPENALAFPDVLVYYTTDQESVGLDQAYLLGSMAGASRRQFALPEISHGQAGQLRFYSLAHRSMLLRHTLPVAATKVAEGSKP